MKINTYILMIFNMFLFVSVLLVSSFFKVSAILGSKNAFFSGITLLGPLVGLWGQSIGSYGLYCIRSLLASKPLTVSLLYHLPGLSGSLYWHANRWLMAVVVPLVCMVIFVMHPVGSQAFGYTLYWFVPVIVYFLEPRSFFFHALATSFIVHAVGSVIWLYTHKMTAGQWWALIPVVFVERIVSAVGMSLLYGGISMVRQGITKKSVGASGSIKLS
jgi:hypothetical protein